MYVDLDKLKCLCISITLTCVLDYFPVYLGPRAFEIESESLFFKMRLSMAPRRPLIEQNDLTTDSFLLIRCETPRLQ